MVLAVRPVVDQVVLFVVSAEADLTIVEKLELGETCQSDEA